MSFAHPLSCASALQLRAKAAAPPPSSRTRPPQHPPSIHTNPHTRSTALLQRPQNVLSPPLRPHPMHMPPRARATPTCQRSVPLAEVATDAVSRHARGGRGIPATPFPLWLVSHVALRVPDAVILSRCSRQCLRLRTQPGGAVRINSQAPVPV